MNVKEAGQRGGIARKEKLSKERRSEIATKAVLARWKKWRAEKVERESGA